ncbi:hypothetical protein, conserved [Plasmodium gonderi]|uniref:Uncharacterized protein n=1 Tax=Plasmodium gonderi TaxID=77519 RepID=A0A1Y1JC86_PLAGO|nr:hypothetical protein, conserved [Plasmodium gonderi]GAW78975.1 hypothetical protein, conserved [Plasmodium gonderi]
MEKCKLKLFLCSFFVWIFVAFTFYKRYRYDFYRNYEEQKVSLYSEESFYFSFFDDIVKSKTYMEGINLLIHDNRSEYPNTINAIRRFNVYPEIVLGTLWRVLNLKEHVATPYNFYVYAVLLSQAASVSTLFFFSVYLGRSYISGVIFLMLFFSCFREKFIMRLSAFSLRENFSSVYMWCNILFIYMILREKKARFECKKSPFHLVCLFLSSLLFFITWQFSVFVMLTHVVTLFGLDLLGFRIQKELNYILITFSCSYLVSLLLTFFPRYLLYTYFPFVLISILGTSIFCTQVIPLSRGTTVGGQEGKTDAGVVQKKDASVVKGTDASVVKGTDASVVKGTDASVVKGTNAGLVKGTDADVVKGTYGHAFRRGRGSIHMIRSSHTCEERIEEKLQAEKLQVEKRQAEVFSTWSGKFCSVQKKMGFMLKKGLTSIVIFLLLRLITFGIEKDDSHVMSLLKVRLHLSSHNFDSMIYSVGSEFNPFTKRMFNMIKETSLFEYFLLFNVILLLYVMNYCVCLCRRRKKIEFGFEVFHAQFFYLIIQFGFFALLMLIISRLRVLALPLMCLLSSLLGSPYLLSDIWLVTMENLFLLGPSKKTLSKLIIYGICLLECIYPFIKYFPTYEYINIMENKAPNISKNMDLIVWLKENLKEGEGIIADIPTSSFLRSTTNFKLVLNPQYEDVSLRKRVQDYYMFSGCLPFSDAKKYYYEKYKVRYFIANIYRCATTPNEEINAFTISEQVDSNYAKCKNRKSMKFCQRVLYDDQNYRTLYRNGKFSVVYFLPKLIHDNSPYEQFDQIKYSDMTYYTPWITRCMQTDQKCHEHIADVARSHLDVLRHYQIGFALYKFVEKALHQYHYQHRDHMELHLDQKGDPQHSKQSTTRSHNLSTLFHLAEFYDYDIRNSRMAHQFYKRGIKLITIPNPSSENSYVIFLDPYVSISVRIQMITSYIYFLIETSLYQQRRKDIFFLYQNIGILIQVANFALDHGFYYEVWQGEDVNEAGDVENTQECQGASSEGKCKWGGTKQSGQVSIGKMIKRKFHIRELDMILNVLCENAVYLYNIRNENDEYIHIYKKMWKLVRRVSHMHECVFKNFHLFEKRQVGFLDYLAFFYLYR